MYKPAQGPLSGIRVLEFAGIGPVPYCGMLLSDLGADVVRIDRPGANNEGAADIQGRGKRSISLNLKDQADTDLARKLMTKTDLLMEGLRPGVMERLGLGPDEALKANPALVYGRMTGWGQSGPLSKQAGHDINYIALTGVLGALGDPSTPPPPPLNLVGDYGGGSMFLMMGLLAGLLHARATGQGQVIDTAIVDGAISLMTPIHWLKQTGLWKNQRDANILDGGAHFYGCYVCSDGKFMAVGAIEPQFYAMMCDGLALDDEIRNNQFDQAKWPLFKARMAGVFANKTQTHWTNKFEGSDACISPVEDMLSAADNPHIKARGAMVSPGGVLQPAPAPRFAKTPTAISGPPPTPGADRDVVLRDWEI
jgi:alpha-methylacyl-CoA racemase